MDSHDIALMAHLLRRAGFGASREELEDYAARGYDLVVEDLLDPGRFPDIEEDLLQRYFMPALYLEPPNELAAQWIYRMINTRRPLEEKMALFWHGVFATGWDKGSHSPSSVTQIETFRRNGLSDLRTILLDLSRDPAMLYWLDNHESHRDSPNENYGRELFELFSMGVGNYTEEDIKNAARAFTGWTYKQPVPIYPYGMYPTEFVYRPDDHDDGEKTVLGETGCLNGEDIVDIIVRQPATARFIARHLYNFFVADEPQVPAWSITPPGDPEAIEMLCRTYYDSEGSIREMMGVLLNSDFFKDARFTKLKSPVELVVGTVKLVGTHRTAEPGLVSLAAASGVMGQRLFNPPTVEGWHTGKEWIDGGTLSQRINFAVDEIAKADAPAIQGIIRRLEAAGAPLAPGAFVEQCLELVGPLTVRAETREALLDYAASGGELPFGTDAEREQSAGRVIRLLQLIVSSREYQFA